MSKAEKFKKVANEYNKKLKQRAIKSIGNTKYKSALKMAIEKEINRLQKKIDERTAPQSIGYIAQREQSKWFLKLLDTVEP